MSTSDAGSKSDQYKGWLYKWTNYLRGYQKRWFVVQNGLLSYYRNQAEMAHTCRGTVNLANAHILPYDACTFIIKNSGSQTFHLKANSEVDRQKWVTALELAKTKAIQLQDADSGSEEYGGERRPDGKEVEHLISQIDGKLTDLRNFSETLNHNGDSLCRLLSDFEHKKAPPDETMIKALRERTTMHNIMLNAMLNSCRDVGDFLTNEGKRWKRLLEYERDQRQRLEEMVEQLAKQHSSLERKIQDKTGNYSNYQDTNHSLPSSSLRKMEPNDSDSDEFHDAEDVLDPDENQKIIKISLPSSRIPSPEIDKGVMFCNEYESDSDTEELARRGSLDVRVIMTKRPKKLRSRPSSQDSMQINNYSNNTSVKKVNSISTISNSNTSGAKPRRQTIPERPSYSLNIWSVMKNCIGKELTKIPMPVNFSEPLSMLQRLTEELEYYECLDKAATAVDQWEEMAYVAAYTISAYSTTTVRTGKPFNPLLGETYELDRMSDLGFRSMAEQVSHHPPAAALHAEGKTGWKTWQEFSMSSKFRGKYLSIIPLGMAHCEFEKTGHHYTWKKVTSTVHNIIVGKLWIDNHGEMDIINHNTGDVCHLSYKPYAYFSRDVPRKVTGVISDSNGVSKYFLTGTWDDIIEGARVTKVDESKGKPTFETATSKVLWKRNPPLPNSERMYHFTKFAIELNEPEEGVAPTDCRLRPDQRLMEEGKWDEANKQKLRLEEKQRTKRRQREAEAENAQIQDEDADDEEPNASSAETGKQISDYEPVWFTPVKDEKFGGTLHRFTGEYWKAKESQDWSASPDIY